MKFGFPLWYGDRPIEKSIKRAQNLGFDYIEIYLDWPWPDKMTKKEMFLLKNIKKKFGLDIALHGPWAELLNAPSDTYVYVNSDMSYKEALRALDWGFFSRVRPYLYSNWDPWSRDFRMGSLLGKHITCSNIFQ